MHLAFGKVSFGNNLKPEAAFWNEHSYGLAKRVWPSASNAPPALVFCFSFSYAVVMLHYQSMILYTLTGKHSDSHRSKLELLVGVYFVKFVSLMDGC